MLFFFLPLSLFTLLMSSFNCRSSKSSASGLDETNISTEYVQKVIASKIAMHQATLKAIADKESLVRREITKLEMEMENNSNELDEPHELQWPETPPPRYF